MSAPKERRVPLIDPGEPPPPPPDRRLPADEDTADETDDAEAPTDPARPSSGRHLPVDIGNGRVLDGEIIDQANTSPHAFRFSGYSLLDF